jgi:hypothetical protein
MSMSCHGQMRPVVAMLALAACHEQIANDDSAYYRWDGQRMHCAINIDSIDNNSRSDIAAGLDRARDRGQVLQLYAHIPGGTVPVSVIENLLADAQARGLAFVTYADMVDDNVPHVGGLAFAFDDDAVAAWTSLRPTFQQYGARITFFVTRYGRLQAAERAELAQLAADGHDIEAHSVNHLRGPKYVDDFGMPAYLADEVQPSIDLLVADGYRITSYAYPFGARTSETDKEIFDRVSAIRSVSFSYGAPVDSPCPL